MDAQEITYQKQIDLIQEFKKHLLGECLPHIDTTYMQMQNLVWHRLPYDGVAREVVEQLSQALVELDRRLQDLKDHITVPDNSYLLSMIEWLEKARNTRIQ